MSELRSLEEKYQIGFYRREYLKLRSNLLMLARAGYYQPIMQAMFAECAKEFELHGLADNIDSFAASFRAMRNRLENALPARLTQVELIARLKPCEKGIWQQVEGNEIHSRQLFSGDGWVKRRQFFMDYKHLVIMSQIKGSVVRPVDLRQEYLSYEKYSDEAKEQLSKLGALVFRNRFRDALNGAYDKIIKDKSLASMSIVGLSGLLSEDEEKLWQDICRAAAERELASASVSKDWLDKRRKNPAQPSPEVYLKPPPSKKVRQRAKKSRQVKIDQTKSVPGQTKKGDIDQALKEFSLTDGQKRDLLINLGLPLDHKF